MGRPLSSSNFGPEVGKFKISFHNGTSVVSGYIVNQIGSHRYNATINGTTLFPIELAQTTSAASSLTAGFGTITATTPASATVYLRDIQSCLATTTENLVVSWHSGGADDVVITKITPAPTASITVTTPANQTAATPFTVAGTFTGNAPTALRVKVGSGSFTAVTSPTIGSGTFSFSLTIPSAVTGTTVTVQDYSGSVAGVQGVSGTFDVA